MNNSSSRSDQLSSSYEGTFPVAVRIAHVGFSGTDDDRDRIVSMRVWLQRNDCGMFHLLQHGQVEADCVELNGSPSRDFLTEESQYDIVVLHNFWGYPGLYERVDSGPTACSALHSQQTWVHRLRQTAALYVFVFGCHFELGSLRGYKRYPVPLQSWLTVLVRAPRAVDRVIATRPITTREMSAARLCYLRALRSSQALDLSFTTLQSADCLLLSQFQHLLTLSLAGTNVSDQQLDLIVSKRQLHTLNLDGTTISDEGMPSIGALTHIRCLSLNDTLLTDAGLEAFGRLQGLEWLSIVNTSVSDLGVRELLRLEGLRYLSVAGTRMSPSGVQTIRTLHPACWVDC